MPHTNGVCYEFGSYRLDVSRRVLTRNGEAVPLTPKATEILILLVSRASELVEKDELINLIWPDSFVEEANISQNIFALRRALGDDRSEPKFIETVVKRGYRFIAAVRVVQCQSTENVTKEIASQKSPVLAVLPLLTDTQDEDIEYLADGLTESIINNLSSVSKVRVMSLSAVTRYKNHRIDPKQVGSELGVDIMIVGRIQSRSSGLVISVELVDAKNGWQLWGEVFDFAQQDILGFQTEILIRLSNALNLKLTGDEQKRITVRYTESGEAYQAYLEGRYHWGRFTRDDIRKAIAYFHRAIELDPNYALAYAGIVDCYLRLVTNYLPPDGAVIQFDQMSAVESNTNQGKIDSRVKLRHEWDWKGAERELRRAVELKSEYPAGHQWYAAYLFAQRLFEDSDSNASPKNFEIAHRQPESKTFARPSQIASLGLTQSELVQIFCAIAREQLEVGNFDSANLMLRSLPINNSWPQLENLPLQSAGDLLFTFGLLTGHQAASGRYNKKQRHAEALLNGALAIFEQLSLKNRSGEVRVELGRCYYREGLHDMAAETLAEALDVISDEDPELKSACLVVSGAIDRETGRLTEAMQKLSLAFQLCVPRTLTAFRCHFELAQTLKQLFLVQGDSHFAETAFRHYDEAILEAEAVGNLSFEANVRNSLGFLLMNTNHYQDSENNLLRAQSLFTAIGDEVRAAMVTDTLTHLFIAAKDYERAKLTIQSVIEVLERNDAEAGLAEALTLRGIISCRMGLYNDAVQILQGAKTVAERCGFKRGLARILFVLKEELNTHLSEDELREIIRDFNEIEGKEVFLSGFALEFGIERRN